MRRLARAAGVRPTLSPASSSGPFRFWTLVALALPMVVRGDDSCGQPARTRDRCTGSVWVSRNDGLGCLVLQWTSESPIRQRPGPRSGRASPNRHQYCCMCDTDAPRDPSQSCSGPERGLSSANIAAYSSRVSTSTKAPGSSTATSRISCACARTMDLAPLAGSAARSSSKSERAKITG